MDDTARQLGSLDARMGAVESDVREIKADVKALLAAHAAAAAVTGFLRYVVPFGALGVSILALLSRS